MTEEKNQDKIQNRVYGELEDAIERIFVWASTQKDIDFEEVHACVLLFGNGGTLQQVWDYYCNEYKTLDESLIEPD